MSTILGDILTFSGSGGSGNNGDIYAVISVNYPVGSVCTATNGTTTLTATNTSGEVIFGISEPSSTPEVWTISCTDGNEVDSTTVSIDNFGDIEYVALAYIHVYGVSWDGTSTTAWTRTDLSANFPDPVPYVAGATNYGSPFDNIYPWKDMIRISDADAGAMVKIPKFWYKLTQNGKGMSIQISDTAQTGYSVCPACMNRGDGEGEKDYILVGRYHCNQSYISVNSSAPRTYYSRSSFRTTIQSKGTGIYMMDWATWFTIQLLYLVEYANWNSQATIGYGCGNGSATQKMGYTDSMPYHTGTMLNTRTSYGYGTQYRYIEGLWDNVYDWIDGCYNSSSGLMLILNPSKFSDNANGTSVGSPASGYPSAFSVKTVNNTFPLFIPSTASGSNSTYSCDYWYFSASYPCVNVGGYYNQNADKGLFHFNYSTTSGSGSYISSRPMKISNFLNESDNMNFIYFKISNKMFKAEPGMTWAEWVDSNYNTGGYIINSENYVSLPNYNSIVEYEHKVTLNEAVHDGNAYWDHIGGPI